MTTPAESAPTDGGPRSRVPVLLAPVLCALAVSIAYSNTPGNAFALDDWHTIQQNPWIRGLDREHIRRFFTDASAFSVLPANLDYRPVLLVTYAANYAISGYDTTSWHLFNLGLHWIVAVHLFLLGRVLIGSGGLRGIPRIPERDGDLVSLGAALVFAVHPITTGCANYISARSSLLVAALALPALVIYLSVLARRAPGLALVPAMVFYAMALFTKVEAVAMLGVLVLAELLLDPAARDLPLWRRALRRGPIIRLLPFAAATAGYITVWLIVSPLKDNPGISGEGMTSSVYLLTEVRAWWYYIGQMLAPVRLVADESAYPVSGGVAATEPYYSAARALADPRVILALSAWALVGLLCLRWVRSAPAVPFLVGAYLILLSPHSSIVPLAEFVNEHRPYLPISGLFLLAAAGVWLAVRAIAARPRVSFILVVLLLSVPLVALTRQRNTVWKDDLSLWSDTAAKTPNSARAHLNLGLAYYTRRRYDEAEASYKRALSLAPRYHYVHTNLALLKEIRGDLAGAAASHDAAVASNRTQAGPYAWRARFRAKQGDLPGATADFQKAVELNGNPFTDLAGLIECLEHTGRSAEARSWLDRFPPPDPAGFDHERASIRALLPATSAPPAAPPTPAPTSMDRMNAGVPLMRRARYDEAEALFREAIRLDPSNHLAHINMGVLRAAVGDPAGARRWYDSAVALAPADPAPLSWRARFLARLGDLPAAIADLREALRLAPDSIPDRAALIECLHRAGQTAESDRLAGAVPPDQAAALDRARADFRAEVFISPPAATGGP